MEKSNMEAICCANQVGNISHRPPRRFRAIHRYKYVLAVLHGAFLKHNLYSIMPL
jgi:hypothetical protein